MTSRRAPTKLARFLQIDDYAFLAILVGVTHGARPSRRDEIINLAFTAARNYREKV